MTAEAALPHGPAVIGYVEAATGTHVLGWAWAPRAPGTRLLVQALLGDDVIAEAPADRARDDLARNGIGDGRHAFELTVPEASRPRLGELRVVVRDSDGAAVPLGAPPPAEAEAERLDRLQRGMDTLVASQRVLHRNLQAALLTPRAEPEGATQADVAQQLAALEVFCMRLDERLAALAAPSPETTAAMPRATLVALILGAAAMAISVWGLLRSLPM